MQLYSLVMMHDVCDVWYNEIVNICAFGAALFLLLTFPFMYFLVHSVIRYITCTAC